ncbi:MAG: gliding motility-associated C-terminal domain-containing protein [Flavobacteriales bacterium]|nr:gliding motility-associated C-terminal domain-containing protein [Flavobacteriales bacterium]
MKKQLLLLIGYLSFSIILILNFPHTLQAQPSQILVFSEDFEDPVDQVFLNYAGAPTVSSNTGRNMWVINSLYNGAPIYPNTINQDSTYGGTINNAPYSRYLHIHDSITFMTNGIGNANWSPAEASDRFVITQSFCTLGLTDVKFVFYYMCEGSPSAYGELYCSVNNGPWVQVGPAQLNNKYKWKYEEVTDPMFNNVQNLRFGFRWVNATAATTNASLAVDDIRCVGTYDPAQYPVDIVVDSVSPNPVCINYNLYIYYHFTNPLCGTGNYAVQISTSPTFNPATVIPAPNSVYVLNNANPGIIAPQIPVTLQPGCYYIRFIRTDITPPIIGSTSQFCVNIQNCPNTITTLQPSVLSNPMDTVCVGSVIDIPFWSTGVFVNNTYVAQLSDSNGVFPPNPNVLGTFPNSDTWDPLLVPSPGMVSGIIEPLFHPIPPGCNYYIRIVGINPYTIGSTYGPFCIRHCDIITNHKIDLHACLTDVLGFDTLVHVDVGNLTPGVVYDPANQFGLQIFNSQFYTLIPQASYPNQPYIGTAVNATNDTVIHLQLPPIPGLGAIGLQAGMYYVRVIGTDSNNPNDPVEGTLIRLTIGTPHPQPLGIYAFPVNPPYIYIPPTPDTTICQNNGFYFYPTPFNWQSSYSWTLNGSPWSNESAIGIIFNGTGSYFINVTETNFGCVGPGSDTAKIHVIGLPNVSISGPVNVCQYDTLEIQVPLAPNTYYGWTSNPNPIIDTANNKTTIYFPTVGSNLVTVTAVNQCGSKTGQKQFIVRPLPEAEAGPDTSICRGDPLVLDGSSPGPSTPTPQFQWFQNNIANPVGSGDPVTVYPSQTTAYIVRVTKNYPPASCKNYDTLLVTVLEGPPLPPRDTGICPGQNIVLIPQLTGDSYVWSTGDTTYTITVNAPGTYVVKIYIAGEACPARDTIHLIPKYGQYPFSSDTSVCDNETLILYPSFQGNSYLWNTGSTEYSIQVTDSGVYYVQVFVDTMECPLVDTFHVALKDCFEPLTLPNIFTPNGDGPNDTYFALTTSSYDDFYIEIYNRWGNLIYRSTDPYFKWDGRGPFGERVSDGVYFWVAGYKYNEKSGKLHGTVTVVSKP